MIKFVLQQSCPPENIVRKSAGSKHKRSIVIIILYFFFYLVFTEQVPAHELQITAYNFLAANNMLLIPNCKHALR